MSPNCKKLKNNVASRHSVMYMYILVLVMCMCGLMRVGGVTVSGFIHSFICRDTMAYTCSGLAPGNCCDFSSGIGDQIKSVLFEDLPQASEPHMWKPNAQNPGCGDLWWTGDNLGGEICAEVVGSSRCTGVSWNTPPSAPGQSVVDYTPPKCTNLVQPTLMHFNV